MNAIDTKSNINGRLNLNFISLPLMGTQHKDATLRKC